jgi:hypothetical protein
MAMQIITLTFITKKNQIIFSQLVYIMFIVVFGIQIVFNLNEQAQVSITKLQIRKEDLCSIENLHSVC